MKDEKLRGNSSFAVPFPFLDLQSAMLSPSLSFLIPFQARVLHQYSGRQVKLQIGTRGPIIWKISSKLPTSR